MATSMAESLELSDALVRGSNTSHRNHLVFRGPPVPNHRQLHHSQGDPKVVSWLQLVAANTPFSLFGSTCQLQFS